MEIITRQGIRKYNIEFIKYELNRWIIDLSKGVYEISSLTYLIAIDLLKKYRQHKNIYKRNILLFI